MALDVLNLHGAHELGSHLRLGATMLRMRLRRTGAKKQPRYRVVVAEARAPRDGAFVDTVGYYDPLTEPATIHIDPEKAQSWLAKGVQPSDPVVRLLRRAGITAGAESLEPALDPAAAVISTSEPEPPSVAAEVDGDGSDAD
jgi:small subunit ribosomal protein S16